MKIAAINGNLLVATFKDKKVMVGTPQSSGYTRYESRLLNRTNGCVGAVLNATNCVPFIWENLNEGIIL